MGRCWDLVFFRGGCWVVLFGVGEFGVLRDVFF